MFYTIYKITNNLNGKIYIGKHQTSDINDDYMGSGKILLQAIKKYGLENFKKEILYIFSNELEMNQKERELVTEEFCKSTSTYNLNPGGKGGFGYLNSTGKNHKHKNRKGSLENLQLGREKARHLRENDPEFKTRVSKSISESKKKYFQDNPANFKGKTHSKKAKQSIGEKNSLHQSGGGNSQFGSRWITNGIINQKIKKEMPIPDGWWAGRIINIIG